eukprot:gene906-1420_t
MAVGPFVAVADKERTDTVTHFGPKSMVPSLEGVSSTLTIPFTIFEDYLQAPFPYPSYQQAFVDMDSVSPILQSGAASAMLGVDLLNDTRVPELAIDTRLHTAYALARQWFGVYMFAPSSAEEWLVEGLAELLMDQYVRRIMGSNELNWRRHCHRQVGGVQKQELNAFAARWIHGAGCPRLRAAFVYNRTRNMVELALRQEGCIAAKEAAAAGIEAGGVHGFGGSVTVRLYEGEGQHTDHVISLTGDATQAVVAADDGRLPPLSPREGLGWAPTGMESPAFLQLRRWKAAAVVAMLEHKIGEDAFRKVVQQVVQKATTPGRNGHADTPNRAINTRDFIRLCRKGIACDQIAKYYSHSLLAINALRACVENSQCFCRVRAAAAATLGRTATASTNWVGLEHLQNFYRDRRFDAVVGKVAPNRFMSLSEYFVDQAVVGAIGSVRDADGVSSPSEVVDFLLEIVKYNDNCGNLWDDDMWRAALLKVLGQLRPSSSDKLTKVGRPERLDPSVRHSHLSQEGEDSDRTAQFAPELSQGTVTAARSSGKPALSAGVPRRARSTRSGASRGAAPSQSGISVDQSLSVRTGSKRKRRGEEEEIISKAAQPPPPADPDNVGPVSVADMGLDEFLTDALNPVNEPSPPKVLVEVLMAESSQDVRTQLLWSVTTLTHPKGDGAPEGSEVPKALPVDVWEDIQALAMHPDATFDPHTRHAAWALLQCLGTRPPSVHRPELIELEKRHALERGDGGAGGHRKHRKRDRERGDAAFPTMSGQSDMPTSQKIAKFHHKAPSSGFLDPTRPPQAQEEMFDGNPGTGNTPQKMMILKILDCSLRRDCLMPTQSNVGTTAALEALTELTLAAPKCTETGRRIGQLLQQYTRASHLASVRLTSAVALVRLHLHFHGWSRALKEKGEKKEKKEKKEKADSKEKKEKKDKKEKKEKKDKKDKKHKDRDVEKGTQPAPSSQT